MRFLSPLRYPGGKAKLANYMKHIIEKNKLKDCVYVEPFAGGAGLALSLLYDNYVSDIVINDISKPIYAFWYSILNYTDDFCDLILKTPVTIEEWYKQRQVQKNMKNYSLFELGFSTFFLNRTNRSGIIKGGVIGGIDQKSKWKIDERFNKGNLILRIRKISEYKNKIFLYNLDAMDLINNKLPSFSSKLFLYLDPPYYKKGKHLYENYYTTDDHVKLARLISELSHYWIVTYDNVDEISQLYSNFHQKEYSLNYSAAKKYKGSEIMIYSNNLSIPKIDIF